MDLSLSPSDLKFQKEVRDWIAENFDADLRARMALMSGTVDRHLRALFLDADGALIEVQSQGLRHGPPEVMARLARGEAVPREAYFFRTLMRFTTGHAAWLHLNRTMAIAVGQREASRVLLDVYRLT